MIRKTTATKRSQIFLKNVSVNPKSVFYHEKKRITTCQKKEAALHFILPPFPNLDITKLVIMRTAANLLILRGQFCSNWCISFPCYIPVLAERQIKEPEADELPLKSHYLVLTGGYKQAGNVGILLPYDNFTSEVLSGIVFYLKDFHSSSFFPPTLQCAHTQSETTQPQHILLESPSSPHTTPLTASLWDLQLLWKELKTVFLTYPTTEVLLNTHRSQHAPFTHLKNISSLNALLDALMFCQLPAENGIPA